MRGGGNVADEVEHRAAADGHHVGVSVQPIGYEQTLQVLDQCRLILAALAASDDLDRAGQLHVSGMGTDVGRDPPRQVRHLARDAFVDEEDGTPASITATPAHGLQKNEVVFCECITREMERKFVSH